VLGEKVLVVGAGLIGLLVVAIASHLPVDLTAIDLMPYRRSLALHIGADHALHPGGRVLVVVVVVVGGGVGGGGGDVDVAAVR